MPTHINYIFSENIVLILEHKQASCYGSSMSKKYIVITETGPNDPPQGFEMRAAIILACYLKKNLIFQRPGHCRTPDLREKGSAIMWELKSPTGSGKKTMENNLRSANGQSRRVVIDLTRCKMHQDKAISRIKFFMDTNNHQIKSLLIITKSEKIIDYFRDLR